MSETAKWQASTDSWGVTYWYNDEGWQVVYPEDVDATLNSLETSLAEAQSNAIRNQEALARLWADTREADEQLAEVKAQRDTWKTIARSRKDQTMLDTIMALEAELTVARAAVLLEGDRALAVEQQLVEVKAQFDAQVGVIKELADVLELLEYSEVANHPGHGKDCECGLNELRIALAHVREPETK